ncbi:MAG: hypothetical protein J2P35_00095 [Actinobacteria bacterium]|nr:hypothetical protein [Actinomycetota bacterium]MBO0784596.1 hypothetical protein [Actinomycetota bacterium]MBO0818392.1 hypothetical protein [Actinomycetota bacterium]
MVAHITVDDRDDRPERMLRDPDRYFADARLRAEQEVRELFRQVSRARQPRG